MGCPRRAGLMMWRIWSTLAPGTWSNASKPLKSKTVPLGRTSEELGHDLVGRSNQGRITIRRVQDQFESGVVEVFDVGVAADKQSSASQSRFRYDQRIVHFAFRNESLPPKSAGNFGHNAPPHRNKAQHTKAPRIYQ